MRHNKKKGLKLGTDASHTKAMKKSLAKALFEIFEEKLDHASQR